MKTCSRSARMAVGVLAALALTACGGGGDDGGGDGGGAAADGNTLSVEAGDMYFEPDSLSAEAGSITFEVENVGGAEHTLVIEDTEETVVDVDPGSTATGTTELEAGTYTFYCDVPGHREAGMEGTLEVS